MRFSVFRVLRNALLIAAALAGLFVLFVLLSGAKGFAVQSDSMAPRLRRGDVVFVRPIDFDKLGTGDIVSAYFPQRDGVFTHRVVEIDDVNRRIRTRGDHTLSDDPEPTEEDNIIGKLWFSVPYVGFLSLSLESRLPIYILLGAAVLLILTRILLSNRKRKSRGV